MIQITTDKEIENSLSKCANPIFILGITPRSGTNFLQDILCFHPDCGAGPVREYFLLHYASFSKNYG